MNIRLHHLAYPVRSLGPGVRLGIWLAGCSRACPGCISPDLQDPASGLEVDVQLLLERAKELGPELCGITISGGEPLEQPEALGELLHGLRERLPFWNVLLYSGFPLREIMTSHRMCRAVEYVDLIISGPFMQDVPQTRPLAGSGNQEFTALSRVGLQLLHRIDTEPVPQLELGLEQDDQRRLIGVVPAKERQSIIDAIDKIGKDHC